MRSEIVASEYVHVPTFLTVTCACVAAALAVGRWWTLALPVVLLAAVFALATIDPLYERVPEDVQAGVAIGAAFGLPLAGAGLVLKHYGADVARRLGTRRR